jgi:hypothetical protein
MWRYLLIYGVYVYPINPRLKISLLHRRSLSSWTSRTTCADGEYNANYLILRVTLASAMSTGKNALGSFYLLVWRRLGHFETIGLPDGKKIIISLD